MPNKLFSLVVLLLAVFEINAQKVVFDLNARVNFTQSGEYTKLDSFDASSDIRLDDTTVIRRYYHFISENTKDYLARTAYEINGLFSIKLSERVSLRTGLGLNYGTYSIGSSSNFSISDVISIDTVYDEEDPIFVGSQCDCYENSSSDVSAGLDRRTHQQMLNLSIPLDIGYDIIPGKLSIRGGAYFQTPLYAAASQKRVTVEMTTTGDMTKCKWVVIENKTTALHGIRNFQWGVSAWATYEVLPRLQLELGVRQQVNDMYVREEYQDFSFDNNSYKPLTFSAGVSYRLFEGGVEE
ncbi:MAG TPA: outer membrane beta-barrel protein [Saprospiraceae bacterium]|nr:outer membrane beta-barrel protein [Saprospiraceae bacterium]